MKQLLMFSFLLFFSCSTATKKGKTLPILNPMDCSLMNMEFSDIIDTVKYIQLDDSMILAGLGNVHVTERCILGTSRYGILMYDLTGRFLRQIGRIGDGPEDYSRYYKMTVDKQNEVVYVFMSPDILLSYSFAGDFLNRIHVQLPENVKEYSPSSIRVHNDLLFFYYSENQGRIDHKPVYWIAIRKNGRIVKCRRGYHDKKRDEGVIYFTYCTNSDDSTMIYWNLYNDTIFHVGPSKEEAVYLWGKGEFRLLETDSLGNLSADRMLCSRIIETKAFLLLSWSYMTRNASTFYIFYDKKKGKAYRLKDNMIYDKRAAMSLRYNVFDYLRIGEHDYILTQTNSSDVVGIPNATPWGIDLDDLEGNPVLVLIRLKDE